VHETGLLTAHTIGGYLPAIAPAYERLGAALRAHGTRLFVQLFHGGREQIASPPRAPAIAPSAIPTPRFRTEPRALTRREVRDVVAGYAAAARLCREGGVDGIEISMAHGYLAPQFFAAATNRRDDEYGIERLRFAREVLAAVREAAGDAVAVGVRLAADEIAPGTMGPEACAEVAAALCLDGGGPHVDFVSAALGHSASYRGSTYIVPPPPEPLDAIAGPAAVLRAALPGVPLMATTRVVDLESAERLVASGTADAVGMTRALIADPDLVAKAADGRAD
jgi:2,4-dienoyl-CoA reductase-like NADH-dependent reductase (Old Yellow Enzyme family)